MTVSIIVNLALVSLRYTVHPPPLQGVPFLEPLSKRAYILCCRLYALFVVDDSQIEIDEKAKYLGVQLDQHLVWDERARYVCTKVSRALGFLKYDKKLLPQENLGHI